MITHLSGIFYPVESGIVGSISIQDATPDQIQARIEMLNLNIDILEKAKQDKNPKQKPKTLEKFINSLKEEKHELHELKKLANNHFTDD